MKLLLAPTASRPAFRFSHSHPLPPTPTWHAQVGTPPETVHVAVGSHGLFTPQFAKAQPAATTGQGDVRVYAREEW